MLASFDRRYAAAMPFLLALLLPAFAEEPMTELVGTARNGKGGAMVVLDTGESFYVQSLDGWPEGVDGLRVVATGLVRAKRYVPEATVGPDGAVSQGVPPGSQKDAVIEGATWHLVGAGSGIEPGPWVVRFSDGSNNHTQVVRSAETASIVWTYDPVKPAESSSGVYDGGAPAEGTLDDGAALALWTRVRALQADTDAHVQTRQMGSGSLKVVIVTGTQTVLIGPEQAADLAAFLATWR